MTYENCKDCACCEYHNENISGVEYSGYYCGARGYLTDKSKIENINECDCAD